jgi:nucleotide-binding universal stress UspA family protein
MGTATDSREDQNGRPWPLTADERRTERRIRMQIDGHPARRPDPAGRQPTIVVGYDGSEESVEALTAAATRVAENGRIVAVYAAKPASAWLDTPYYSSVVLQCRERAGRLFDELSGLDLGHVTVEAEFVDGPLPEALAEVARRHHAGEIVVGSRGMGRVRAAMRSVAHRLLRIADRPVVVVPKLRIRAPAHTRHA